MRKINAVIFFCIAVSFSFSLYAGDAPPKLILQITIDSLRGDMPWRHYNSLSEDGFRFFIDKGIVYTNAFHGHANTETIVGHATLATGADPSEHGLIGNVWFDREKGRLVYNIEDDKYTLLGKGGVDKKTEIDSTQKVAGTDGRSPSSILVSTFSDELALHFNGQSKIYGVSVKDRGAVSMAGHAGKAFWFTKKTGEFVTSSYYYQKYPEWVKKWNQKRLAFSYGDKSWELMNDKSTYLFGQSDDKPYETDIAGYGRVFPHPFGPADSKYFTTLLTLSPVGDDLTLNFAKELLENEKLGQDDIPDYLSISFSSTDYVGHIFGPSSLEAEENILRLDKTLADLVSFIDKKVGLDKTLIVLSSDHGCPDAPGYLNEFGIDSQYVDPEKMDKEKAINAIKEKFGIGKELIESYFHPYLYLNHEAISEKGLDLAVVTRAVAKEVEKLSGINMAIPSIDLQEGKVPDTRIVRAVLRNYNHKRSGDIYIVFEPFCFINDFDGLIVAATHGSPWQYDMYVPVVFAGMGLSPQKVSREVETIDIAPTLSNYLGLKRPSGANGKLLYEVLEKK